MRRRGMYIETRAIVLRRYAARPGRVSKVRRGLTSRAWRLRFLGKGKRV